MITRSAIFRGRIHEGREDEFYRLVAEEMIPAWRQMRHALAVRVWRPERLEPGLEDIFLVQQIDYPSLAACEEALSAPEAAIPARAHDLIRPLYEGYHAHIFASRLPGSD